MGGGVNFPYFKQAGVKEAGCQVATTDFTMTQTHSYRALEKSMKEIKVIKVSWF